MTDKATQHTYAAEITQWLQNPDELKFWFYSGPAKEWREVEPRHVLGALVTYPHLRVAAEKPTDIPRRMCTIESFAYPEPEREAPPNNTQYYAPAPSVGEKKVTGFTWYGDDTDLHALAHGFVHLTREAAQAHSVALALASKAAVARLERPE